jgi:hypothetical protein
MKVSLIALVAGCAVASSAFALTDSIPTTPPRAFDSIPTTPPRAFDSIPTTPPRQI